MTAATSQYTDFSKDVLGRYVCNGLDEARASVAAGGRPFDIVIVGGGSFGAVPYVRPKPSGNSGS